MEVYISQNNEYTIRTEQHQGATHIVVPVIMMVEGVHSGSAGPLLHLATELGRFPGSWDGIPVVVHHPEVNGQSVSANSPSVIDREIVGRVYHTHMEGTKLKAEVWLNESRISEVSPQALLAIKNQEELDVSIGVFTDDENTPGRYHGVSYNNIARNHRPDHLALLPGAEGACDWGAGCGIRNNKKGEVDVNKKDDEVIKTMKGLLKDGLTIVPITSNEQGFRELTNKIQNMLDAMDNDINTYYFQEAFDDYFVYRVSNSRTGSSTLYKNTYEVKEDESVEFTGDPIEVHRKVEYVVTQNNEAGKLNFNYNDNKGGKKMEKDPKSPCCLAKVEQLVAHKLTNYTKDDTEWLLTLKEEQLDKMLPKEAKPEVNKKEEKAEELKFNVKVEDVIPATFEELLAKASPEFRDQYKTGMRTFTAQKEKLVDHIVTNSDEGVWDKVELMKEDMVLLEKIGKTIKVPVDYSGMSTKETVTTNKVTPLMPTGAVIKESK